MTLNRGEGTRGVLRVTVVFEHDSQEKVAECLEALLPPDSFQTRQIAVVGEEDVLRVAASRHMAWPDIVILTIGGRETTAFMAEFRRRAAATAARPRPLFVSMNVGLMLDRAFLGSVIFRQAADVILVNRSSEIDRVSGLFTQLVGAPGEIRTCLCPIFSRGRGFLDPGERDVICQRPVRSILFAVQTDIPSSERERTYIAQRLVDYARAHPDRRVIIKPRHQLDEKTAHAQRYAYEHIFQQLLAQAGATNLVFTYTDVPSLLPEIDLLVSLSSTAIVEALSWGYRAASILDLGVRENLGNTYFVGSGLLATFDDLIADRVPMPDPEWLRAELEAPDVAVVLSELRALAQRARAGELPFSPSLFLDRSPAALPAVAPALLQGRGFLSISQIAGMVGSGNGEAPVRRLGFRLIDDAREKLRAGDWAAAFDVSKAALVRTPAASEHMFVAATALGKLGRLEEAVSFLKRARQLRPNDRRLRWKHRWLKKRLWLNRVLGQP